MTSILHRLPRDMLLAIADFLPKEEIKSIRQLDSALREENVDDLCFLRLNERYSRMYWWDDGNIRAAVHAVVKNPKKNLALTIWNLCLSRDERTRTFLRGIYGINNRDGDIVPITCDLLTSVFTSTPVCHNCVNRTEIRQYCCACASMYMPTF